MKEMIDGEVGATDPSLLRRCVAFNRHDVDAFMSFMTDDCVFEASAGSDANGMRYRGA